MTIPKSLALCCLLLGLLVFLGACDPAPGPVETPTQSAIGQPVADQTESPQVVQAPATQAPTDACTDCHTDEEKLKETADPVVEAPQTVWSKWTADLPALEPWQKVLVDAQTFPKSIHGLNGCMDCHGGQDAPDKETAHQGVIRNPSKDAQALCGQCHPNIVAYSGNSLHMNLAGFDRAIHLRSLPKDHAKLDQAVADNCSSCHVSCGECHVSRPNLVGGGFVDGHNFQRKPSMVENCATCHESRAGSEYMGQNEGQPADVHFQAGLECANCHTSHDLHGQPSDCLSCHPGPESAALKPEDHRYGGIQSPRCESCHANVSAGQDDVLMHQMHGSKLSCQVCHSVEYNNCEGCHATPGEDGQANFTLDKSYLGFLIGRNPKQSYERPYNYVPVRHAPITRDFFKVFGVADLGNFDQLETWHYATPHNIQRKTPQTASCQACHGNPTYFLTRDKVAPDELEANRSVIVESPPPPISAEMLP